MTTAGAITMAKPTKARTAAQKRRDKAARRITLAGGESVAQRPTGRDRTHTNQPAEPADRVALDARARRAGCTRDEARDPLLTDDLGLCIRFLICRERDRRDLAQTWRDLCAAKLNWNQRILCANPHPQAAAIAMLPEPMETDQSASVDLRHPDERDAAAKRIWEQWLADLMTLPAFDRHALRGAIDGYAPRLWDDRHLHPTRTGCAAVEALVALHKLRGA
jgi:hypothetical protein